MHKDKTFLKISNVRYKSLLFVTKHYLGYHEMLENPPMCFGTGILLALCFYFLPRKLR